jgi:hypothetical protein
MATILITLAILVSLCGMLLPMLQAVFPRISLVTYYRQRAVRRALAAVGAILILPVWIIQPSPAALTVTSFLVFFWLVSELVLIPTNVIPPLDDPRVLPAKDATIPEDTQVIGIVVEGQAHAWPMGILIPHHIINESIQGRPVTAAYCPACRSGYVYEPVVDGQRLTFEPVSVHRRNMIMRDRETGTIWQHETGEALMGKYKGKILEVLGGEQSNWKAWRGEHPETTICARPVGYHHPSPLGPIFERLLDEGPKHLVGPGFFGIDRRLSQHAIITGITIGEVAKAYPLDILQERGIINDVVEDHAIVIFFDPSSDRVRCFSLDGLPQKPTLKMRENQLKDPEKGLSWDYSGHALKGAVDALKPVNVQRKWWVAWSEYHPGSLLFE